MSSSQASAPDDRARDGLDHLQAAARELIAAARAVLDVAESLVDDPSVVTEMVATLGSLGRAVVQSATGTAPGEGTPPAPKVERVRVS